MSRSLIAVMLSLLLIAPAAQGAPAGEQPAGEVKALIPDASRNAQPLAAKDTLQWNDLLETNAKGRLRAGLTDGSILNLGSNSQLRVVQHDAASQQTSIDLNYGKLRSQVVKITKPGGKYEVKTPNAVIGVIGTDFYVAYENGRTIVICYEGSVSVTPAEGAKVVDSNNGSNGSEAAVMVLPGHMVVVGPKDGGGAAEVAPTLPPYSTLAKTGKEQTIAGESHHSRWAVIAGMAVVAGLTIGLTQSKSSSKPCGCK